MAGSGSKARTVILCIVLGVLILAAGGFCAFYFGYLGDGKVLLTQAGQRIESGDSLGRVESGTEFGLIGTGEYDINIYAYASEGNDFSFRVGAAEERSWAEMDGQDLTPGFGLERGGFAGFGSLTVTFTGLEDILQTFFEAEIAFTDAVPEEDLFRLVIAEGGETRLSVTFGLLELESLTLDPPYIIF